MGPAALVRIALLLLIFGAAIVTPADADLWGHLAFGRDIVSSSQPIQTDRYSFTADQPWINHEWLSEVLFFAVYRIAGAPGLIAFKLSIIAAVLIICLVVSASVRVVRSSMISSPRYLPAHSGERTTSGRSFSRCCCLLRCSFVFARQIRAANPGYGSSADRGSLGQPARRLDSRTRDLRAVGSGATYRQQRL